MMKNPISIVFMGTPYFSVTILEALVKSSDFSVLCVVTQPDKKSGRGQKLKPSPIKIIAQKYKLHLLELLKFKNHYATLKNLKADFFIVAAYGRILPKTILDIPKKGCINIHASLLPSYRGASPIAHAIMHQNEQTGISIMHMDEGLDTGAIYVKKSIPITPEDTTQTLTKKLSYLGAEFLLKSLPHIFDQTLHANPQENNFTYAPLLKKHMGKLDFSLCASKLEACIRAFNPWPIAFFLNREKRVQINKAHVFNTSNSYKIGEIIDITSSSIIVNCGKNALSILSVKPEGKKWMPATSWANGRFIKKGYIIN